MDSFVTTEWLHHDLIAPDLSIFDCSVLILPDSAKGIHVDSRGRVYAEGQISGAVHEDLKKELCNQDSFHDFMTKVRSEYSSFSSVNRTANGWASGSWPRVVRLLKGQLVTVF